MVNYLVSLVQGWDFSGFFIAKFVVVVNPPVQNSGWSPLQCSDGFPVSLWHAAQHVFKGYVTFKRKKLELFNRLIYHLAMPGLPSEVPHYACWPLSKHWCSRWLIRAIISAHYSSNNYCPFFLCGQYLSHPGVYHTLVMTARRMKALLASGMNHCQYGTDLPWAASPPTRSWIIHNVVSWLNSSKKAHKMPLVCCVTKLTWWMTAPGSS